jgi:hypothetical protein
LQFVGEVAAGIAAAALVGLICTTGIGCVILGAAAAGAASAAYGYGIDTIQGEHPFDVGEFATETAVGAGIGAATAGLGIGVSRGLRAILGSGTVAAAEPGARPLVKDAVSRLLYGARQGEGLPGATGVNIARRPSITELENLTAKHEVEFAVTYRLGPKAGGRGGQYRLFSGDIRTVHIDLRPDEMWIYHTHPNGAAYASRADRNVLRVLREMGSPQRMSRVIPVGEGRAVPFTEKWSRPSGG